MIYWERVNPNFTYNISTVLDHDVWQWEDPEGWTDGLDLTSEGFEFSKTYPAGAVSKEIRDRLGLPEKEGDESDYTDYLVLYYQDDDGVHLSLIATADVRLMRGFSLAAPRWWIPLDGLTPMQVQLERATGLYATIREFTRYPRELEKRSRAFKTSVGGYCSECGLLDEYHADHKVPGYEGVKIDTPAKAQPYYKAYQKHYGGALARMTDREILTMPLPVHPRRLVILMEDLKRRIENPQVPKGAMERLLGHNLLDE